jgi:hypothetical protein
VAADCGRTSKNAAEKNGSLEVLLRLSSLDGPSTDPACAGATDDGLGGSGVLVSGDAAGGGEVAV